MNKHNGYIRLEEAKPWLPTMPRIKPRRKGLKYILKEIKGFFIAGYIIAKTLTFKSNKKGCCGGLKKLR
jgi:hypothetical protein